MSSPAPLPDWLASEVDAAFDAYSQPPPGGGARTLPVAALGPLLRALGQAPTSAEIADWLAERRQRGQDADTAAAAAAAAAALSRADVHALIAARVPADEAGAGAAGDDVDVDARAAFECMAGPDECVARADLARVLQSLGAAADARDLDAMLAAAGQPPDGRVPFAAFVAVLAAPAPGKRR